MDYRLSEDQKLLVDGVRDFLTGECRSEAVRAASDAGAYSPQRWQALVGMGVVGTAVAEVHGGMGLNEADMVALLVEAGRVCLPEPLLEAAAAAGVLSDLGGEIAGTWLPRIAAGAHVRLVLPDVDPYPAHVGGADLLVIVQDASIECVDAADIPSLVAQPTLDRTRPAARLDAAALDGLTTTTVATGDDAASCAVRAAARGATYAAAMLVGCGHAMIEQAVAYAGQREQFGKPIGTFQAVKHHLATALVDVTFARPLVEKAADTIARAEDLGQVQAYAAAAKAFAGEAADAAARHALQVHGAIGYTDECDLQLWMKRTWALNAAWGDTEAQWQAVEAHLLTSSVRSRVR